MRTLRWKYAVMRRFPGGQGFLTDYDTENRPRVGLLLAFRDRGVYRIVGREDPKGNGDGIGTIYVKEL